MHLKLKQFFNKHMRLVLQLVTVSLLALISVDALAQAPGGGMPWEGPLTKIMQSISGPVAKAIGVIAIVIAGLGIAFGESGSGVRRLFQVVMGLAIAFSAASLVSGYLFN